MGSNVRSQDQIGQIEALSRRFGTGQTRPRLDHELAEARVPSRKSESRDLRSTLAK